MRGAEASATTDTIMVCVLELYFVCFAPTLLATTDSVVRISVRASILVLHHAAGNAHVRSATKASASVKLQTRTG